MKQNSKCAILFFNGTGSPNTFENLSGTYNIYISLCHEQNVKPSLHWSADVFVFDFCFLFAVQCVSQFS